MIDFQRLAERAMIVNMITKVYPTGIVSLVSDTYDFWAVISEDMPILKPLIMKRDGKVVLRPDSGDPVDILCGSSIDLSDKKDLETAFESFKYYNNASFYYKGGYYVGNFENCPGSYEKVTPTPEMKGAVECLWEIFGGTTTSKGFKTLDSHIGLIYGDSINLERAVQIFTRLAAKGFASDNVVLGIGSFTYQFVTRDTYGTAVKATYGVVNGVPREISKNPKTDNGTKKSAVGLIRVEYENGEYVMYDRQTPEQEKQGELKEIFRDGQMVFTESVETIRNRLHGG